MLLARILSSSPSFLVSCMEVELTKPKCKTSCSSSVPILHTAYTSLNRLRFVKHNFQPIYPPETSHSHILAFPWSSAFVFIVYPYVNSPRTNCKSGATICTSISRQCNGNYCRVAKGRPGAANMWAASVW